MRRYLIFLLVLAGSIFLVLFYRNQKLANKTERFCKQNNTALIREFSHYSILPRSEHNYKLIFYYTLNGETHTINGNVVEEVDKPIKHRIIYFHEDELKEYGNLLHKDSVEVLKAKALHVFRLFKKMNIYGISSYQIKGDLALFYLYENYALAYVGSPNLLDNEFWISRIRGTEKIDDRFYIVDDKPLN